MKLIIRKTIFALAMVMMCALCSTNANAQCPSGWTAAAPFTVTIPGTTCLIKIHYCTRVVGGVVQVFVNEVDPLTAGCSGLNPLWLIDQAASLVWLDPAITVPPCGGAPISMSSYRKVCWYLHSSPMGGPQYFACFPDDMSDYCLKLCDVCEDQGPPVVRHVTNCFYQESGNPDCATAPANWETWQEDVCYKVPCGE